MAVSCWNSIDERAGGRFVKIELIQSTNSQLNLVLCGMMVTGEII